jgi:small subunit ribosomal protein S16
MGGCPLRDCALLRASLGETHTRGKTGLWHPARVAELQRDTYRRSRLTMAVKIKLTRLGKIRNPQYRIAVADARTRRDGRAIEIIGRYHPKEEPSLIEINSERAQYWLSVGAQPTEPVLKLLKITGDWQKFKGLPGAEGRLKTAKPKPSKLELFNAALAAADGAPDTEAAAPKKKKAPAKKAADKADKTEKAEKADKADKTEKPSDEAQPAEGGAQAEQAEPASES